MENNIPTFNRQHNSIQQPAPPPTTPSVAQPFQPVAFNDYDQVDELNANELMGEEDQLVEYPVEVNTTSVENEPINTRLEQKTTTEFEYSEPTKWDDAAVTLSLPTNHDDETRRVIDNIPNISLIDDKQSKKWIETISSGLELTTEGEVFVPTLEDPTGDFRQVVDFNNSKLCGTEPRFKEAQNQKLTGERGVIRMTSALGLGTLFNTPLWHSGIWITFKAPGDSAIVEINRMLVADKIRFGRATYSLAFSNLAAYTTDKLIKFALDHVYDTTLKPNDLPEGGLREIITCQDIPSLLWGFICTWYPRGFQYNRACINDPVKCNHVVEERLNVSKLQWTNNSALTEWQKTHMAIRRPNSKSLADVKRYQEELSKIQNRRVLINNNYDKELAFTLKTPTIDQHIDSGQRWIGDIVNLVDNTIGSEANEVERNRLIVRHGQASAMRQYSHWVESIEVDSNIVDDIDTVEKTINEYSRDDVIRNSFNQSVVDYINQSTISVIGIPVYNCPNCKLDQSGDNKLPRHENVIPLDVNQTFFALASARLTQIARR